MDWYTLLSGYSTLVLYRSWDPLIWMMVDSLARKQILIAFFKLPNESVLMKGIGEIWGGICN